MHKMTYEGNCLYNSAGISHILTQMLEFFSLSQSYFARMSGSRKVCYFFIILVHQLDYLTYHKV